MDHPARVDRPYIWRTTAVVASALAAFELALLVVIALVFVGSGPFSGDPVRPVDPKARAAAKDPAAKAPAPTTAAAPVEAAKLPRAETSVIVLNGNGIQGAAAQATEKIRRYPYLVAGTGNAPRTDFARSLVMYRPGFRGEALRLAKDLGLGRVSPLDGLRAADLQGAQVALVVGAS